MNPHRIVVVGTGTNVGKTHLAVALVSYLTRSSDSVCGLKPIESGVPAGRIGSDARDLADASVFHVKHPQPYAFPDPVSPHLAARRMGVAVDLARVTAWVDDHPADWVVVETAGALLSPIAPGLTNLDLAKALQPDTWLLVAVDRLGVLHDVAACVLALRAHGVAEPPLVVLQKPDVTDGSTGTNADELVTLGTVPRAFEMPRDRPTSLAYQAATGAIAEALGT
jgi:dethiobiotin synthetase